MAKNVVALPSKETILARTKWSSSGLTDDDAITLHLTPMSGAETGALSPNLHKVAALKIPYFDLDGDETKFWRVRYLEDLPGFAGAATKPQRYAQAPGSTNEVYLPPLLNKAWRQIAKDVAERIIITEGELKAAAGCLADLNVMGLGGVDVWRSTKKGLELLPVFDEIEWQGRVVVVLFDSDAATNPNVVRAQRQLAKALLKRGARPAVASLPVGAEGQKQGVDDYLIAEGADRLLEVVNAAQAFDEGDALWALNEEVILIRDPGVVLVRETGQIMDPGAFAKTIYANRSYREVTTNAAGQTSIKIIPTAPRWIKWPARAEARRITYEPGEPRMTKGGEWNGWKGWGCEPKPGDVQPWHDLTNFLFQNCPSNKIWVEKWLAFPLQNPGVKLLSSVVIYGQAKGTGKTFIAYLMGDIYGDNFIEVDNDDLGGAFNAWAKNKQFIYGDEITGGESRLDADKLKRIITRETVTINDKYVPHYTIPDRCNYLLTSNHPDAVFLEDGDRRYFIHEVIGPPCATPGFYDKINYWRKQGGASHLFHYLLNLDLGNFAPRAAPPDTEAKRLMSITGKSDLGAWVNMLKEAPETALRALGPAAAQSCDLYTSAQLLRAYDPDGAKKVTAQGLGKEMARSGFRHFQEGRLVRTSTGPTRLWMVRNWGTWATVSPLKVAAHFSKFFGPIAGPDGKKF